MRFTMVVVLWIQAAVTCLSQVQISPLFTDHALIQQDKPLQVWGNGPADEIVTVSFQSESKSTKVNSKGEWSIKFKAPESGGPFILTMNDRVFQDIYVGDVWLAGGQSNMEWKMASSEGFEEEKVSNIPRIHYFKTPHALHNKPQWDITSGEWIVVDSSNLANISGVAFFFSKEISSEIDMPIGIVDHSWGGTNIQGWMSPKGFTDFPEIAEEAEYFTSIDIDFEKERNLLNQWYKDMDAADIGIEGQWSKKSDFSDWMGAQLPGQWEDNGFTDLDGVVYYARQFQYPTTSSSTCQLNLGQIDDSDETYINGTMVGSMENAYDKNRLYKFSSSLLGDNNTIVVRVRDNGGGGGFSSSPELMYLECGEEQVNLAGGWKMKIGTEKYPPRPMNLGPNSFPSIRYQAMMHPLFKLSMKGMIWYQGETNTYSNPEQYGGLFRSMILDYRRQWNQKFPFLFVQLANFEKVTGPESSSWAILRDEQASVLDLPLTAMATAIDIGESDDIHPRNKKDVGKRLANAALSIAYNKPRPYKNASMSSYELKDSTLTITFDNFGLRLRSKTKGISALYVETPDGTFTSVSGILRNNQLVVNIPEGSTALYYAWSNNPGTLSLFGSYGLPVLPFRIFLE